MKQPLVSAGRSTSGNRIPSLDGLRAISICLVISAHLHLAGQVPGLFQGLARGGGFGVDIFFVISGFLITSLLINEESAGGEINLAAFYLRRAVRILPPAFLYLFALEILRRVGEVTVSVDELFTSALFVRNISNGGQETGHFWSLAIEEQFYLTWPFLLVILRPPEWRLRTAAVLVLVAPVWRQITFWIAGSAEAVNSWRFDQRADALIVGCLLALARREPAFETRLRRPVLQSGWMLILAGATIWLAQFSGLSIPKLRLLYPTMSYIAVALIINDVVDRPQSWAGKWLNTKPLAWLGTLSYSLYLWQQLFCVPGSNSSGIYKTFPLNLCLAIVAACGSYYFVERPLLSVRSRIISILSNRRTEEAAIPPVTMAADDAAPSAP